MTDHDDTRPEKTRHRRPKEELDALRTLARQAALRGESLASIRAHLQIPEPTLTLWARQDGYRQADLKARAEARKQADAARGEGAAEIEAIRQQAGEAADGGHLFLRRIEEARLGQGERAGAGKMERFQNQAAVIVRQKGLDRVMAYAWRINEAAEADRAARDAAGLPPLPPPEPKPISKEEADAFYAELREKGRTRDYWSELAELRRREREVGLGMSEDR